MNNKNLNIFIISDSLGLNGWGEYSKSHIEILLRDTNVNLIIFYKLDNTICDSIKKKYKKRLFFVKLRGLYIVDLVLLGVFSILYLPKIIHFMSEPISKLIHAIKIKSKIVQTVHGTYGELFLSNYKRHLDFYDLIIFDSDFTKNYFNLPIKNSRQYVLFPYSTALLKIEKELFDENCNRLNQIIFIGNSKERKGLNLVLEMYDILKKDVKDLQLLIIGNLNKNHLSYIKEKPGIFHYKDLALSELIKHTKISKVNILPSINIQIENKLHFEGYGLVHVESIKLGTPSIGTLNTGNESFIVNGINGFLIEQNNLADLVDATRKLINKEIQTNFHRNVIDSLESINSNTYSKDIIKLYGIERS